MSEWQPIESAPKDGAYILAYWHNEFGKWYGVLVWSPDYEGWAVEPHFEPISEENTITHWMPLPEPPEAA